MQVTPRIQSGAIFAPGSLVTNGFTIGRAYDVIGREGNCYVVRNDNGHERAVLPGGPCPHIVSRHRTREGWPMQTVVGYFELEP